MKRTVRLVSLIMAVTVITTLFTLTGTNASEIDLVSTGSTARDVVNIALGEVGVSGRPNKYTYAFGSINGTYSYDWCHAFATWCGNQAGDRSIIPQTASCGNGANFFINRGQFRYPGSGYVPKAGDFIYFTFDGSGYDHVGIVTDCQNGYVYTVEGNSGDKVVQKSYELATYQYISGYGLPAYAPDVEALNLGADFYGFIVNDTTGYPVENTGTNVVLGDKDSSRTRSMLWHFEIQSDRSYKITSFLDSKVLDVQNGVTADSTNVWIYENNDSNAQRWYVASHPTFNFCLVPKIATDKTLDVGGGALTEGANIQIYTQNGSDAQRFSISNVGDPMMLISDNLGDSFYATVNSSQNSTVMENTQGNMTFSEETHTGEQVWIFEREPGNLYKIKSYQDGKVLTLGDNGKSLSLSTDNGTTSQKWYLTVEGNGLHAIACAASTSGAVTNSGSSLTYSDYTASYTAPSGQKFTLNIIDSVDSYLNPGNTDIPNYNVGDVDGDGQITVKDATQIQKFLAALTILDDTALLAADTNGDMRVNIVDATQIQKFLAAYIDKLG